VGLISGPGVKIRQVAQLSQKINKNFKNPKQTNKKKETNLVHGEQGSEDVTR